MFSMQLVSYLVLFFHYFVSIVDDTSDLLLLVTFCVSPNVCAMIIFLIDVFFQIYIYIYNGMEPDSGPFTI